MCKGIVKFNVLFSQSHPFLCHPMDCSPPDPSVLGILWARILEQVAISFSRGSSRPRDWTCISCIGRWVLYHRATGGAHDSMRSHIKAGYEWETLSFIHFVKTTAAALTPSASAPFAFFSKQHPRSISWCSTCSHLTATDPFSSQQILNGRGHR